MSRTVPPETIDLTKFSYDPMYAKDGSIVLTKNGLPSSAKLTREKEIQIDRLALEGKPVKEIAKLVRTTAFRVTAYLHTVKSAEAIAYKAVVTKLVEQTKQMADQNGMMVELLTVMERRLSDVQTELKQVRFLALRQKQGRYKAEKTNRSQRHQIIKLRRDIWKRTGKDPL